MTTFLIVYLVVMGIGQFMYWIATLIEEITPVHEFLSWKNVQTKRKDMLLDDFRSKDVYKGLCETEKEYAQDFLVSMAWFVGILVWPLTLVIASLWGLSRIGMAFKVFASNFTSVFLAARGEFKE